MNSSAALSSDSTVKSGSNSSSQSLTPLESSPLPDPSRPAWVEVRLDHLAHNLRQIQQQVAPAQIIAVVKANAYGHGLVPIARFYEQAGIARLGVALLEEALALRAADIQCPILVFGGLLEAQVPHFLQQDIEITVSSLAKLQQVEGWAKQLNCTARIHLKLDTGMGRIGTRSASAGPLVEAAVKSSFCELMGVFSHFACSDDPTDPMTMLQLERFQEGLRHFERLQVPTPPRHLANSGAVLHHPASYLDLVRPGILLYGILPDPVSHPTLDLRPALSLKARTVFQKGLPQGHSVSYGATWKAARNTWISTIPLGYGDGFMRSLSGKAQVLHEGNRYPVVGRICMDQLMIETQDHPLPNDAEVVLIGRSGRETITVETLAAQANTIPYEILTNLNTRLPRRYLDAPPS